MHFIAYLMAGGILGLVIRWVYLFERARRELKLERQRRAQRERLRNSAKSYPTYDGMRLEAAVERARATYKPQGKYVRSQQADETPAPYVPNYDFGASRDYTRTETIPDWSGSGGSSGGGGASASWDSSSSSSSSTPDFGNVESGSSSTEN